MLASVVDAISDVIPSLNGWRQRVEVLHHNKVQAEGQEQELANEMSKNLEWHTGTMKIPSKSPAENDFDILNIVVADGQTLYIVFLLECF